MIAAQVVFQSESQDLRMVALSANSYAVEFKSRDRWARAGQDLSAADAFVVYDQCLIPRNTDPVQRRLFA